MAHHITVKHILPILDIVKSLMHSDSRDNLQNYIIETKIQSQDELKLLLKDEQDMELKMLYIDKVRQEGLQEGLKKGQQKGIEKGREEGVLEGRLLVAKELLQKNGDINFVASVSGLTVDQLKSLL